MSQRVAPQPTTSPVVTADQWLTLADGVRLATDIYRSPWPAPVILRRTPYNRRTMVEEALLWVSLGYAFVAQDVRGRGDSEGTWEPGQHESDDGEATLRWIAHQPWCDGRVIASGWSYEGFAALALPDHPALVARILGFPFPGARALRYGEGTVVRLAHELWWWLTHGSGRSSRPSFVEAMLAQAPALLQLPPAQLPTRLWGQLGAWPPFGTSLPPLTWSGGRIPLLLLTGWYDAFVGEALRLWQTAPPGSTLVVGCWTSALNQPLRAHCARNFGPAAELPLGDLQVAWLEAILTGAPSPLPPVQVFLIGTHRWVTAEHWPPEPLRACSFPLGADGQLGSATPGSCGFPSDPTDPVPTPFPADDLAQRPPRADQVAFLSAPLPAPLRWYGSPRLELTGSSNVPSVDWLARLAYREPDGRTFLLGESLVEDCTALGPSHQVTITLPPQAVELPAGSRLLLEVAGSSFPGYAINPHTGQPRENWLESAPAHQWLLCGPGGSRLILPVAEASPWTPA
ncbi:MAG: putative peptidase [Dehalococcoidia bacterium]|nr:MAG: putative peptidase [Dehalococcoidia bacterium]